LGTEDDGTTLRSNIELGVNPDFDDTTDELWNSSTRDLTLTHKMTVNIPLIYVSQTIRGSDYKFGYAYIGPKMKSLDMYNNPFSSTNVYSGSHTFAQTTAVGGDSTETTYISPMKMENWKNHFLSGLNNTSLDGEIVQMPDYDNDNLKTYIAHPTEIRVNYN
jgi:hypothetical protein